MRVFLPRLESARPEAATPAAPVPVVCGHETLLLVEDEEFVRELVREFLETAGYTVLEAASAEDALRLMSDTRPHVDLLLTDVVLPGMNGAALAERLQRQIPRLETLYISGYPGDAMFGGAVFDPGPAFLPKPFTRHLLTRKVREMLNARPPMVATILVQEPDEGIRRLLAHILTAAGYEVVTPVDAAAPGEPPAGTPAGTPADRRRIDVAIVDLGTSEQQGLAALHALRNRHPEAAVVLMGGAFGDALLREAAAAGVSVTLQKPLNEASVLDAVARARRTPPPSTPPDGRRTFGGPSPELAACR
jgi:DNA-binding NtrC family response regulator